MKIDELVLETLKEIRSDVKEIREAQIAQGFDIKENKENLIEHMKRTELLESRVEILEEKEIGKKYLMKVAANAGKITTLITGATGIIYAVIRFLK